MLTKSSRRSRRAQFAKCNMCLSVSVKIEHLQNCVHGSCSLENTLSESSITTSRSRVLKQSAIIGGNYGSQFLVEKPYFLHTLLDFVQMEALLKAVRATTTSKESSDCFTHMQCLNGWCYTQPHFVFSMAQQSLVGQGLLIIGSSRSHSDTPH